VPEIDRTVVSIEDFFNREFKVSVLRKHRETFQSLPGKLNMRWMQFYFLKRKKNTNSSAEKDTQ
jgi:hypothetical protein